MTAGEPEAGHGLTPAALTRIGGHLEMIQRLTSMVASELVAADGLTEAQALTAMAQVYIACGAHTACMVARDYLGRSPDYAKWKISTDDAFRRAAGKIDALEENLSREVTS